MGKFYIGGTILGDFPRELSWAYFSIVGGGSLGKNIPGRKFLGELSEGIFRGYFLQGGVPGGRRLCAWNFTGENA